MDDLIAIIANQPIYLLLLAAVLGLVVGSFLNVVIYRLPLMLFREWREQCTEFMAEDHSKITALPSNFSLLRPASHCPNCQRPVRAYENIPVISYLWLRGRCPGCQQPISYRYPGMEIAACLSSLIVAYYFGFGWPLLAALIFTWVLLCITMIDIDHQIIPDNLSLPGLWLGLAVNLFQVFTTPQSAIVGAMVGYSSLWLLTYGYKLLTGKVGMGHGDFKLFAMLGAWLGWQMLPLIILLSSLVGTVIGITILLVRRQNHNTPLPFGPYLAIAGWIALIWGNSMMLAYLPYLGIY